MENYFGDANYSFSLKHAAIIDRSQRAGQQVCVSILSCPDYVAHHRNDSTIEQVNGNIPLKTQQRIQFAEACFPGTKVRVLFADSEILHKGKISDEGNFMRALETSKLRVATKYGGRIETSSFFELAGGRQNFEVLTDYFYERLLEAVQGGGSLSRMLQDEVSRTLQNLSAREVLDLPSRQELGSRILKNSFAEFLAIGELLRSESSPDGTSAHTIIFDASRVTSMLNEGYRFGSELRPGLAPLPLILANPHPTV